VLQWPAYYNTLHVLALGTTDFLTRFISFPPTERGTATRQFDWLGIFTGQSGGGGDSGAALQRRP